MDGPQPFVLFCFVCEFFFFFFFLHKQSMISSFIDCEFIHA